MSRFTTLCSPACCLLAPFPLFPKRTPKFDHLRGKGRFFFSFLCHELVPSLLSHERTSLASEGVRSKAGSVSPRWLSSDQVSRVPVPSVNKKVNYGRRVKKLRFQRFFLFFLVVGYSPGKAPEVDVTGTFSRISSAQPPHLIDLSSACLF